LRTIATATGAAAVDRQVGLLWGAVAVAMVLASPLARFLAHGLPACPFKMFTGIPCPGCGTTRAALALATLHPVEAFVHYPLPTLAWTAVVAGGFVAGAFALLGRALPPLPRRLPTWVRVGFVVAVLANWAYSIATGV